MMHSWAVATLQGNEEHKDLRGTVRFESSGKDTLVIAEISGLPDSKTGFFAMHIHEGGDCGEKGFADTGAHFNPKKLLHPRHAGDLPPLLYCDGYGYLAVLTGRFSVADVVGKTVVIHDGPDDFKTQPSGDSGSKIACGVIRWGNAQR